MKELKIVNYPDPVLLSVGKPIHDGDFGVSFEKTVEAMFSVMENAGGVGLAAPQVGISKRFFVMDIPEDSEEGRDRERHVLINPEILSVEGEQIGEEGCLSFPGLYQTIKREMRVIVKAQNQHGGEIELDLAGLAARCVLHETDHCDGILFIRRLSPLRRDLVLRKFRKLQKKL